MSDRPDPDHDPSLDSLAFGLRGVPDEPPPAFMAAVRRRRRRAVLHRAVAIVIPTCVIAMIALAISLPALRGEGPRQNPIVKSPRVAPPGAPGLVPTAATLRRFIDDPTVLDGSVSTGAAGRAIRAGDRPESEAVRSLLTIN